MRLYYPFPVLLVSTKLFGQTIRHARPPKPDDTVVFIGGLILAILVFVLYFLPSIVAIRRKKMNRNAIIAFNLFLGWSIFGWAIALVWALKVDEHPGSAHF